MLKLHEEFESARVMRHFMPVSLPVGIMLEPIMLGARLFGAKPLRWSHPWNDISKILEKVTPDDASEIQALKIPYAAVSLNLVDGKPYMIEAAHSLKQ